MTRANETPNSYLQFEVGDWRGLTQVQDNYLLLFPALGGQLTYALITLTMTVSNSVTYCQCSRYCPAVLMEQLEFQCHFKHKLF